MYPVVIACIFLDFLFHRYEFRLTSKSMFKIVGKRCNTSLNIGTGMSEQILYRSRSECSGTAVFPNLPVLCGKLSYSQITENESAFFFNGNCCRDCIWQFFYAIMVRCISKAVSCSRKGLYCGEMGSQP